MRHATVWLATGFGLGYSPVASGTVGALLGVPWTYAIACLPSVPWQWAVIAASCLGGIWLCTAAARHLGGAKDPGAIVFDEITSLPITFMFLPLDRLLSWNAWPLWLAGFVLNRLCDILKPPPARQFERLPEGLGIMADDMASSVYAGMALLLIDRLGWLSLA